MISFRSERERVWEHDRSVATPLWARWRENSSKLHSVQTNYITRDSFLFIALQYTFFLLSKRLKGVRLYSRTSLFWRTDVAALYVQRGESVVTAHLPHALPSGSSVIGQKARPYAYNRSVCSERVRKGDGSLMIQPIRNWQGLTLVHTRRATLGYLGLYKTESTGYRGSHS